MCVYINTHTHTHKPKHTHTQLEKWMNPWDLRFTTTITSHTAEQRAIMPPAESTPNTYNLPVFAPFVSIKSSPNWPILVLLLAPKELQIHRPRPRLHRIFSPYPLPMLLRIIRLLPLRGSAKKRSRRPGPWCFSCKHEETTKTMRLIILAKLNVGFGPDYYFCQEKTTRRWRWCIPELRGKGLLPQFNN